MEQIIVANSDAAACESCVSRRDFLARVAVIAGTMAVAAACGTAGGDATGAGSFLALGMSCTHQGTKVDISGQGFSCPNHGAQFDGTGAVTRGPAASPLYRYGAVYNADAGTLTIS